MKSFEQVAHSTECRFNYAIEAGSEGGVSNDLRHVPAKRKKPVRTIRWNSKQRDRIYAIPKGDVREANKAI